MEFIELLVHWLMLESVSMEIRYDIQLDIHLTVSWSTESCAMLDSTPAETLESRAMSFDSARRRSRDSWTSTSRASMPTRELDAQSSLASTFDAFCTEGYSAWLRLSTALEAQSTVPIT